MWNERNRPRAWATATSLVLVAGLAPSAKAIDVFLDWSGFEVEIAHAWDSAGWTGAGDALTASDYLFFKHEVKGRMAGHFAGYSIGLFETAPAGVHEVLKFGSTTTSTSLLGKAERIDWRNKHKDDVADMFLKNYGFIAPKASYGRVEALDRLANGIVGTASHELGHNLGLQHYDAYGHPTIKAPTYAGIVGQQNDSIMATGSTGLTGTRRGEPRFFNPLEKLKLAYAEGLSPSLGTTIAEAAGSKDDFGDAQAIFGTHLPVAGTHAVNVEGSLDPREIDFYKIEAGAGALITANIFSAFWEVDPVDTSIAIYDDGGTVLATNGDISFSGGTFMTGSGHYSGDSLILNLEAAYTGVYYISVAAGADGGDYELLVSGLAPVPEPATIGVLGLGVLALLRRRKKR